MTTPCTNPECAATRALLDATQEQLCDFISAFCALRDAMPRAQVQKILIGRHPVDP